MMRAYVDVAAAQANEVRESIPLDARPRVDGDLR
jgi:hypothetical protein